MTIDEMLKRIKEKMACDYNISGCDTCNISSCEDKDIVIQLAEWLEELKVYQQHEIICHKGYNAGYNKAIDDFTGKIKESISESLIWGMIADCFKYKNMNDTSDEIVDYVINTANEIAEQLKAGGAE